MPVRSIATFQAKPGRGADFEAAYREGRFLERAVTNPGFIRGELLRVIDDPDRFVAIAEWVDADAYAAWQAAYDRLPAEPTAAMFDALVGGPVSLVGEVIITADRATTEPPA
jgi:heme-degrading monooxygenase HmoA